MTLKEFQKTIYKELRQLQAQLIVLEYSAVPEVYIRIKKGIDKMIEDLEYLNYTGPLRKRKNTSKF